MTGSQIKGLLNYKGSMMPVSEGVKNNGTTKDLEKRPHDGSKIRAPVGRSPKYRCQKEPTVML